MRPNDAQSLASRSPLAQYRFVWDWCCTLAPGMNAGDNPDVGPAVAMITTQDESACSSRPAMLTGAVNIAVFAAFWPRVGRLLLSNAEFKPVCRICELDVSRYGWQKRQDPARSGNEVATKWQGRRQKRQGWAGDRPRRCCRSHDCKRVRLARLPRYAVVQGAGGAGWHHGDRTNIPQDEWAVKGEDAEGTAAGIAADDGWRRATVQGNPA